MKLSHSYNYYLLIKLILVLCFVDVAANETIDYKVKKLTLELRCMTCQNQSVYDSDSDFAISLKLVVKKKINNGLSEKEIYDFLTEKYGEWIVYKPQLSMVNSALWFIPYLVFLLGGILLFTSWILL